MMIPNSSCSMIYQSTPALKLPCLFSNPFPTINSRLRVAEVKASVSYFLELIIIP